MKHASLSELEPSNPSSATHATSHTSPQAEPLATPVGAIAPVRAIGTHLILDFWKAKGLDDLPLIKDSLRDSAKASGATILDIHLHHFTPTNGPNNGVTGVAILAESHISIHTWPEKGYAAVDIFMCGDTHPERCIEVLCNAFKTTEVKVSELLRGVD